MLIRIIVLLLIIIGCDIIVPTIMKKIHKQAATCETPESFTIVIPRFVFWLGIVGSNLCVLGLLVLPIFDDPDWIFLCFFLSSSIALSIFDNKDGYFSCCCQGGFDHGILRVA